MNNGAWASLLHPHDSVDALNTAFSIWCEAVVLGFIPREVHVQFRGWAPRYDERLPLTSPRLASTYSRVTNGRVALSVGQRIQIETARPRTLFIKNASLGCCDVVLCVTDHRVDTSQHSIGRVLVEVDGKKNRVCIDSLSDGLCAPGTHKVATPSMHPSSPFGSFCSANDTTEVSTASTIAVMTRNDEVAVATPAGALRKLFVLSE